MSLTDTKPGIPPVILNPVDTLTADEQGSLAGTVREYRSALAAYLEAGNPESTRWGFWQDLNLTLICA
ncbi:hypothetical protein [Deinococcus sp. UYEF24]